MGAVSPGVSCQKALDQSELCCAKALSKNAAGSSSSSKAANVCADIVGRRHAECTDGDGMPADPFAAELVSEVSSWPASSGGNVYAKEADLDFEVYEDGSKYKGHRQNGVRHGYGVWKSEAESYDGEWQHDQRHGHGTQTWKDGRVYEGQFRDGKFEGEGRMEWQTLQGPMVFEGQYVDDMKHGQGRYMWPDGRVYDGEWRRGQRCGRALYVNSKGEERFGIWVADRLDHWCDTEPPSMSALL
mmetsp:Transcript_75477/g.179291  ORF Transcript_75477/g.179291 Transcript_75477/m.179291 type:complete len:243 (+) Transcript_75477:202-930(+)